MRNTTRMVLLALVVALAAPSAFAKPRVSILGGGEYLGLSKETAGPMEVKGDLGYGGGLLLEFPMGKKGGMGFELGALGVYRNIKATAGTFSETTSVKTLNAPVAFRFWTSPRFSFHAGGYYERYFEDEGKTYDYGATGGFRLSFPKRSGGGFFFEPRYNHGLRKIDGETWVSKSVLGLVGMTFGGKR